MASALKTSSVAGNSGGMMLKPSAATSINRSALGAGDGEMAPWRRRDLQLPQVGLSRRTKLKTRCRAGFGKVLGRQRAVQRQMGEVVAPEPDNRRALPRGSDNSFNSRASRCAWTSVHAIVGPRPGRMITLSGGRPRRHPAPSGRHRRLACLVHMGGKYRLGMPRREVTAGIRRPCLHQPRPARGHRGIFSGPVSWPAPLKLPAVVTSHDVTHADRYARAEEFMTAVKALWDSWCR
jgi:hypothetical protein